MTLTFLDKDNNQVSSVFRIAGIYDIKNSMFEQVQVFMKNDVLCKLAGIDDNSFHQLIIRIKDVNQTDSNYG